MAENYLDLILRTNHSQMSQGLAEAYGDINRFANAAEGGAEAAGAAFDDLAEKAEDLEQATEDAADGVEEAGKKLRETGEEAKKGAGSFNDLKGPLTELGVLFGGFAAGAGLLTKGFVDSASQMQQFEATLTAVMKSSTEAKKALNEMVAFAASTPFEVPSIVQAGVQIRSLGLEMNRVVPLAGELAAVFNRGIPDAANALGKAMTGSQDGITMLADAFGISRTKMREFGAEADSTGTILAKTPEQVKKLQDALERIIKTEFGGAMAAQSATVAGAFSNLSDSIGRLSASFGDQLIPLATEGARRIGALVDKANELPEAIKGIAAFGVAGAGAVAAVVGGMLGLVTVAGVVITNFKALDEALVKTVGPERLFALGARFAALAGAATILVGAFAAFYGALSAGDAVIQAHVDEYKALDRATADAAARMAKLAEAGREDWAGKSGAELVRMGVSTRDVANAITALNDKIEEARNRDDLSAQQKAEVIGKLQEQRDALRDAGQGLSEYISGTHSATDAQKTLKNQITDTTKAMQEQVAANERDSQALAEASAERARMEAQDAQQILQHRQALGTATIEDQKRVTEAVKAAAEAEKQAKLQAIQQAQDAASRAVAEDPTKVFDPSVFQRQRENVERAYTMTVEAESRRRTEVQHKEAEERKKAAEKAAKEAAEAQKKADEEAVKSADKAIDANRQHTAEVLKQKEAEKKAAEEAKKAREETIDKLAAEDEAVKALQAEYDKLAGKGDNSPMGSIGGGMFGGAGSLGLGSGGRTKEQVAAELDRAKGSARQRASDRVFADEVNRGAPRSGLDDPSGWEVERGPKGTIERNSGPTTATISDSVLDRQAQKIADAIKSAIASGGPSGPDMSDRAVRRAGAYQTRR